MSIGGPHEVLPSHGVESVRPALATEALRPQHSLLAEALALRPAATARQRDSLMRVRTSLSPFGTRRPKETSYE